MIRSLGHEGHISQSAAGSCHAPGGCGDERGKGLLDVLVIDQMLAHDGCQDEVYTF